jgi:predicted aconitase
MDDQDHDRLLAVCHQWQTMYEREHQAHFFAAKAHAAERAALREALTALLAATTEEPCTCPYYPLFDEHVGTCAAWAFRAARAAAAAVLGARDE